MTEASFLAFTRPLPEPHLLVTAAGTIIAANPAAVRLFGLEDGGEPDTELAAIAENSPEQLAGTLAACARSGSLMPGSLTLRGSGERHTFHGCAVGATTGGEQRLVMLRFQTQRSASSRFLALNHTIDDLTRESRARRQAEARITEAERRASFLAEASRLLAASLRYDSTLGEVARLAVPRFADWCAIDVLDETGRLHRVALGHDDPEQVRTGLQTAERFTPADHLPDGVQRVIRTGATEFVREVTDSEAAALAWPDGQLVLPLGLRAYVAVPLSTRNGTLGALTLAFAASGRSFSDADVPWAEDLGRRVATAIENARLVETIEEARDRIADQAAELEMQTEELRAQSAELEEKALELEQLLEESGHARTEAERANQAKSQFLAVMSHELRTPLNAIIGYTDLLDAEVAGPLNRVQREQLDRARSSARHLVGLIDQVLSLARIEAGHQDVHPESIDVVAQAREIIEVMEPLATARGLDLRLRAPDRLVVVTDGGKLRQILFNLVGNAVKFTETGHIELEVAARHGNVLFRLRDTGPGIAAENLDRIFDPFTQVDQHNTRRVGGSGLGLSVSRELARMLGGGLEAESVPGHGSTFTLRIPAPYPDIAEIRSAS
jgi:signal transduction histidine kinase